MRMKLNIRYENIFQTIELDAAETEQLWVSLSLEEEKILSQVERERRIQKAFDEEFNKPEYNCWHRENRHIDATPKRKRMDGRRGYIQGDPGDPTFDIMDYLALTSDAEMHAENFVYRDICDDVRVALSRKPDWADAFIAVRMDGESIREYAARTGESENNITQKLKRAEKKLRDYFKNRQI